MTAIEGCTHRTQHKHGTVTGYTVCRCRCNACLTASRRDAKTRRAKGIYNLPAVRAYAYVQELRAAGMTDPQISQAAHVAYNTIYRISERKTIRPVIEDRILAVPLGVTAVGVQRRLRALMAIGWSGRALATELGVTPTAISETTANNRTYATRKRGAQIAALYDRLSGGCPEPCRFTVEYAKARKWAPPMAWDEIDDARAKPQGTEHESAMGRDEFVAELLYQAHLGRSWTEALTRLGVHHGSTERRLHRAGRWAEVSTAFGIREARAA